jgi:hypothetical protein
MFLLEAPRRVNDPSGEVEKNYYLNIQEQVISRIDQVKKDSGGQVVDIGFWLIQGTKNQNGRGDRVRWGCW